VRRLSTIFSIFKVTSERHKRNERATRNDSKDGRLETWMMLIFRQMPNRQQIPAKSEQLNLVRRRLLSASSERQWMKLDL